MTKQEFELHIQQVEKELLSDPHNLLWLDGVVDETLPIEDFIVELVSNWNIKYSTYHDGNTALLENVQCEPNKHRSITDIYCICRYYRDDINLLQLVDLLFTMASLGKIWTLECSTIDKITFYEKGGCYPNS